MNKKEMLRFLEEKSAACLQRRTALWNDDRRDEADFEKIQANVYDIFKTVLTAAGEAAFPRKLKEIPAAWTAAYAQAERRGDAARMHIEKLKLDAVAEIAAKWGRSHDGDRSHRPLQMSGG